MVCMACFVQVHHIFRFRFNFDVVMGWFSPSVQVLIIFVTFLWFNIYIFIENGFGIYEFTR